MQNIDDIECDEIAYINVQYHSLLFTSVILFIQNTRMRYAHKEQERKIAVCTNTDTYIHYSLNYIRCNSTISLDIRSV